MKIWQATVLLLVMLLADLLSSFGLAYVGVVHYSWLKHHPLWRHTVTETALDVAALSAVRSVAVMLLVCLGGTTLRGTKTWATELLQAALRWLFGACQLLLASKAVAVAMYGGLDSGRSGLTEGHSLPAYLASTAVPGAPLSELSLTYVSIALGSVLCGGAGGSLSNLIPPCTDPWTPQPRSLVSVHLAMENRPDPFQPFCCPRQAVSGPAP
mmetsp:Transcript_38798/g.109782  ORF Transcript_38798/g.109782 Transcript_38798/m.109782 type:complete len:212 (+) Transcript_38798:195-830(+)